MVQISHPCMTTGKTIALTRWTFVGKGMSLLFNVMSKLAIAFLPRNKHLLFHGCSHNLQWFQSTKTQSLTVSIVSPSICHDVMVLDAMILVFWMLSFKPTFSLSSFTFHQGFPGGSEVKVSAWNVGDQGSIPGSGRSPGEGDGNPL